MKKLAILLLSALFLMPAAVDAKGKKKPSAQKQNYNINYENFTGYYDNTGSEAARRRVQIRNFDSTYSFATQHRSGIYERTINEGTEGILGQDEIRLNEKGEYRNLNSNTGVPLPANTGGSGR